MILVSGATGNVGSEVVRELLARGADVRATDYDIARVQARFGNAVEAAALDFLHPETAAPAMAGVDGMFLLRPPQISDVEATLFPVIDAAVAAGVKRFVFLSLIGIENLKRAPHYKVEQRLQALGLDFTFLRCSFFMQNLNTSLRADIRDRSEIYIPVGQAKTSFLDVRDIGGVAALTLTQDGHSRKAYDLTGSEALDYFEVADLLSEVLGRKVTYRNPSTAAYLFRQLREKKPLAYALVTAWLYSNTRGGMADEVTNEVDRLLRRAPVPMRQYIEDYKDFWQ
jgi:uncharacterized protein YbjT (DUF2867 family)